MLIGIFSILSIKLFQFVSVSAVPDPVADRMSLEVQHLVDLECIGGGRHDVQPAPDGLFYIFIEFIHPFHLFFSSLISNPIIFRYGIHPYCPALMV